MDRYVVLESMYFGIDHLMSLPVAEHKPIICSHSVFTDHVTYQLYLCVECIFLLALLCVNLQSCMLLQGSS